MKRDFGRLGGGPFDLLVVGGGIYGAWTAYDAALRGLRVALVEQGDWASSTSSASSKLIHGGLRYLEYARIGLVRKALVERRRLARLGPHRILPLRFVLPLYSSGRMGRMRLGIGLSIYDRLGGRGQPVEGHCYLDRRGLIESYDFLDPEGLSGGFTFGDCGIDDARYTLEIVDGALDAGVVAVNRARAVELTVERGVARGARIRDLESGAEIDLRATVTVSCTGAWAPTFLGEAARRVSIRLSKGVHLVLPSLSVTDAVLIPGEGHGQVVFLIPWYGRTLVGTTDTEFDGDPARLDVGREDTRYLLARANTVLRGSPWNESDVIGRFAGLRVLPSAPGRSTRSVTRELSIEEPVSRLLVSVGGKITSSRADASTLVDRAMTLTGHEDAGCRTSDRPFPWTPGGEFADWRRRGREDGRRLVVDSDVVEACLERHGSRIDRVFGLIEDRPELARRITDDAPFCDAEIVHAVRHEMARSLADVLRRRIPLLLVSRPDATVLERAAALAGDELGWSDRRRADEIVALLEENPTTAEIHEPA